MKYIETEKLKAEIERRKYEWTALLAHNNGDLAIVKEIIYEDMNIIDFIDSLPSDKSEKPIFPEDLIEESKTLYNDIDSCIIELLKARTDKDQEAEGKALFRMEGLMVATQQHLSCIIDGYEPSENIGHLDELPTSVKHSGDLGKEEQTIKRAKELYPKLLPFATYICGYAFHDNDGVPKESIQKYLSIGAQWQKEQMIIRAIKWIEYNNKNGGCRFDGWQEDFKKEMED